MEIDNFRRNFTQKIFEKTRRKIVLRKRTYRFYLKTREYENVSAPILGMLLHLLFPLFTPFIHLSTLLNEKRIDLQLRKRDSVLESTDRVKNLKKIRNDDRYFENTVPLEYGTGN